MNMKVPATVILVVCLGALAGCSSIARGITQAIFDKGDEKDTRACKIEGAAFEGVETLLRKREPQPGEAGEGGARRTTKILMIHGIGTHQAGYSTRFAGNLTRALNLTVAHKQVKEIDLHNTRRAPGKALGHLTIRRFLDKARTRELLFYELTWSSITKGEKQAIEYDDSGKYSYRRANMNNTMKVFLNDHISDPLIYAGKTRELVVLSFLQATCWMTYGEWEQYEDYTDKFCTVADSERYTQQLAEDDYVIVTHSLGSRVAVDAWQRAVEVVNSLEVRRALEGQGDLSKEGIRNIVSYLEENKKKDMQLYMLSNQLPLLQLGREQPEVKGQIAQYCRPDGPKYDQRMFKKLRIVAFSDPNDLFSYAIPSKYAHEHMDSRMCPEITNVVLNVAAVTDLFGLGEFASPAEAHSGYDNDERVIALIAKGIGDDHGDPIVQERCTWLELVEE